MKIIELLPTEKGAKIKSPFDQDLIDAIKAIHWKRRRWNSPCWEVDFTELEDENANNLEYLREICQSCAESRGWIFSDHTAGDRPEDELTKEIVETHYSLFKEVLQDLPDYSLNLTGWSQERYGKFLESSEYKRDYGNILDLELVRFLDDTALFNRLKDASINMFRPSIHFCSRLNKREKIGGYEFLVPVNGEIIKMLANKKTKHLVLFEGKIIKNFEDGVIHALTPEGELLVCHHCDDFDMSSVDFSGKDWTLLVENNEIYFARPALKILEYHCTCSSYQVISIGHIGHPVDTSESRVIPNLVEYHLTEWFENTMKEWANVTEVKEEWNLFKGKYEYAHPFDLISENLSRFDFNEEGEKFVEATIAKIKGLKRRQRAVDEEIAREKRIADLAQYKAKEAYYQQQIAKFNLQDSTVKELKKLAEEKSIYIPSKLKKQDILKAIVDKLSADN